MHMCLAKQSEALLSLLALCEHLAGRNHTSSTTLSQVHAWGEEADCCDSRLESDFILNGSGLCMYDKYGSKGAAPYRDAAEVSI